jgi:hypothetical protein
MDFMLPGLIHDMANLWERISSLLRDIAIGFTGVFDDLGEFDLARADSSGSKSNWLPNSRTILGFANRLVVIAAPVSGGSIFHNCMYLALLFARELEWLMRLNVDSLPLEVLKEYVDACFQVGNTLSAGQFFYDCFRLSTLAFTVKVSDIGKRLVVPPAKEEFTEAISDEKIPGIFKVGRSDVERAVNFLNGIKFFRGIADVIGPYRDFNQLTVPDYVSIQKGISNPRWEDAIVEAPDFSRSHKDIQLLPWSNEVLGIRSPVPSGLARPPASAAAAATAPAPAPALALAPILVPVVPVAPTTTQPQPHPQQVFEVLVSQLFGDIYPSAPNAGQPAPTPTIALPSEDFLNNPQVSLARVQLKQRREVEGVLRNRFLDDETRAYLTNIVGADSFYIDPTEHKGLADYHPADVNLEIERQQRRDRAREDRLYK